MIDIEYGPSQCIVALYWRCINGSVFLSARRQTTLAAYPTKDYSSNGVIYCTRTRHQNRIFLKRFGKVNDALCLLDSNCYSLAMFSSSYCYYIWRRCMGTPLTYHQSSTTLRHTGCFCCLVFCRLSVRHKTYL